MGGANKTEQPSTGVGQKLSNLVESRRRSVSSSREGTPSTQSVVDTLASKSERNNASRTPTPTPSPRPPPPAKSSLQALPTQAPVSATPPQPLSAPVIPRPSKAQEFARNRIRRMQMFSAVKKPTIAQGTPQSQQVQESATTGATGNEELPPQQQRQQQESTQPSTAPSFQSLPPLPPPPQPTSLSAISNSLNSATKMPDLVSHPQPLSAGQVTNGSHLKPSNHTSLSPSPPSDFSRSSHSAKLANSLPKATISLSQIVTNSLNHEPSTSTDKLRLTTPSTLSSQEGLIAHKIGTKGQWDWSSNSGPETKPELESFVVRIPRNLVHVPPRQGSQRHKFSGKKEATEISEGESVMTTKQEELIISINLLLLRRARQTGASWQVGQNHSDTRPDRTEQLAVNHRGLDQPTGTELEQQSLKQDNHADYRFDEPMETDYYTSLGRRENPSAQPQLIPSGAYPGVDGCLDDDGYWYPWTETIPGRDEAVTVLPYVYIDDDSCDTGVDPPR